MSRVFVAEQTDRLDLTDTQRFGDIIYLNEGGRRFGFDPKNIAIALHEALKEHNFNPDEDYICLAGNILIVSVLVSVCVVSYGEAPILVFNSRTSTYNERELLLEEVKL